MYYVYAVYNQENNKIYIGQTENLEERINLHNSKTFKGSYTSRFSGDWKLVYKEEINTRQGALRREKQLKSYRGREHIKKLINISLSAPPAGGGSALRGNTTFPCGATVAQLPVKKTVVGSNPTGGANIKNGALSSFFYIYFPRNQM